MDISSLYSVGSKYIEQAAADSSTAAKVNDNSFDSIYRSALGMINETNALAQKANEEEIKWLLGQTENPHDLTNAQAKATASLNYTIAVRDRFLEAYKEIINMQV